MRHSDIKLTMGVYTDPKLLDVRGALDALPLLPLGGGQAEGKALKATGTEGDFRQAVCFVAPTVAPTSDNPRTPLSFSGKAFTDEPEFNPSGPVAVSGIPGKRKEPLTTAVSGSSCMGATGLEPVTPSLSKCPFRARPKHEFPLIHRHFTHNLAYLQAHASVCEGVRKTAGIPQVGRSFAVCTAKRKAG